MENEVNKLEKKYDEENGLVFSYDRKGRCFVSFSVGKVPLAQWEEWSKLCEVQFNSSRWQKFYLDHKMHETYLSMTVPPEIAPKEEEKKDDEKEITLLSGEKI